MRQAITTITTIAAVSGLLVSGCSNSSENISAAYVSPLTYRSYDCDQLTQEAVRVGHKVVEVAGVQDDEAAGDAVAMGVGLVIFWPALFFLGGSDREQELARLKGELEGIEQAAIEKNCRALLERINKGKEEQEEQEETAEEQEQT